MFAVYLQRLALILSLVGTQVAGYLTLAHLHVFSLVCWRLQGCDRVAHHASAHGFGIPALAKVPTAAFGLIFFCAMAFLYSMRALLPEKRGVEAISKMQWELSMIALLVSAWLAYLEAFVIQAWCVWCLASAGVVVLLFLLTTAERLRHTPAYVPGTVEVKRLVLLLLAVLLLDSSGAVALRHTLPDHRYLAAVAAPAPVKATSSKLVPKGSYVRGKADAEYTLVEFGDYACPSCYGSVKEVEKILKKYPDSLNYVFHYVPVEEDPKKLPLNPRAAQAAGLQEKYWEMHDALYAEEEKEKGKILSKKRVLKIAKKLELDMERFERDLNSKEVHKALDDAVKLSDDLRIEAAPTFFIIAPKDKIIRFIGTTELKKWVDAPGHLPEKKET